ncbi:hypothetical protein COCNU_03G003360 [Cocos nucifera]|uniref:DUF4283 domain-containing protein n=1 Tax=Cocos nucifera TaxID=13894 RepID=A0A8K0I1N9_COCNU|nr:hypothetical protein COCNU_03G003360 [Cocos nucifera]
MDGSGKSKRAYQKSTRMRYETVTTDRAEKKARGCRRIQDPKLLRGRLITKEMEDQKATPEPQEEERPDILKVFLPVSAKMAGISAYLDRAAKVEIFGRQVKADDVGGILEQRGWKLGSWSTRQVAPRKFFVSCLDKETIMALMAEGHIRGDDFTVIVNHWNHFRGGVRHKLRYKVYATLKDLPLFCWTTEVVAGIISDFAVPHRASRTSLWWDDLKGFDIIFFYEDISSIQEKVEVTIGSHTYSVGIVINFITE